MDITKDIQRNLSLVRQQVPVSLTDFYKSLGLTLPHGTPDGATTAPYFNEFGNITGGLPTKIKHQVKKDLSALGINNVIF